jgi:tRNA pseudouridine38-40 synthase
VARRSNPWTEFHVTSGAQVLLIVLCKADLLVLDRKCTQCSAENYPLNGTLQRKMIGLAVLLARSQGPPSLVNNLYTQTRVRIPKAPALGLLLEEPVFESYNKKVATANAKWKDAAASGGKETEDDGEHAANFIKEPVDFEKYKTTIEKFKETYIYDAMQKTEDEHGT